MSEWWTYSLSSFLLFSPRTYYRLFELTNADVWPLQIVTLAIGVAIIVLIVRGTAWSGRAVAAMLAALWLFVAWAYMLERYDSDQFGGTLLRDRFCAAGRRCCCGRAPSVIDCASTPATSPAKIGLATASSMHSRSIR